MKKLGAVVGTRLSPKSTSALRDVCICQTRNGRPFFQSSILLYEFIKSNKRNGGLFFISGGYSEFKKIYFSATNFKAENTILSYKNET